MIKQMIMKFLVLFIISFTIFSCKSSGDRAKEIEKNMLHYGDLLLRLEADSLANCFTAEGELRGEGQKPVIGQDSIRKVFKSFAGAHMLEYKITMKPTLFKSDTGVQEGSYFQKVIIPQGDTLELGGEYSTKWIKVDNKWLLKEMYTYGYKNLKK